MKAFVGFLKTTLLGGVLFLVPFTIGIYVLREAISVIHPLAIRLLGRFHDVSILGVAGGLLAAILALLLLCFLAGLLARTGLGKGFTARLEDKVLMQIPGYGLLKSMAAGWAEQPGASSFQVALVRTGEAWQLGFVVDRLPDGRRVVFMPEAPSSLSGPVLVLPEDCVQPLDARVGEALKCLKRLGAGSAELLGKPKA